MKVQYRNDSRLAVIQHSFVCTNYVLLTPYSFYDSEFDECSSSPCLNGGTCTDGKNNYTCTCPSPFFGNQCQGTKTPTFQLIRKSCFVLVISVACCCSSLYYLDRIIKCNIDRPYIYFHRLGDSGIACNPFRREQLRTNQLNQMDRQKLYLCVKKEKKAEGQALY